MTKAEFNQWLRAHRAAFPGLNGWFSKLAESDPGDPTAPTPADVVAQWYEVLSDCSLADCLEATRSMARHDLAAPWFGDHPGAVRDWARSLAEDRYTAAASRVRSRGPDGEPTYACLLCEDHGLLHVWHPEAMLHAAQGLAYTGGDGQPTGIPCSCRAGDKFLPADSLTDAELKAAQKLGGYRYKFRFDPDKWLPARGCRDDEWPELVAFMAGWRERNRPAESHAYSSRFSGDAT